MFSSEDDPDMETVCNMSEFLGDTFNIWDNDSALVYCICEGWLLLSGFIIESMSSCRYSLNIRLSYVFNLIVGIFLILTHDLGLNDQIMNSSSFYMIWMVWIEV
jgi:hypothetical protein